MSCKNNCVGCNTIKPVESDSVLQGLKDALAAGKDVATKNYDRFDLEQQILSCWNITDDLKFIENDELAKSISTLYDAKFEKLWAIFEDLVANKKFT